MGTILLVILNVIILVFVYYKFVKAIRNKSEESILAYKREVRSTVSQFNVEFDRNLTLLENRSNKIETLMKEADEYVHTLLNLEKELDVERVNNLVEEVKLELDKLSIDQKTLKETIIRERIHSTGKLNTLKKENSETEDKAVELKKNTKSITYGNNKNEEPVPAISYEKNNETDFLIEKTPVIDYKKLLHGETNNVKIPVKEFFSENTDESSVNPVSDIVQKAYLKTRNFDSNDGEINNLLDKTLNYEHPDEKISDKKLFETELSNSIGKNYIYNNSTDDLKEQKRINKKIGAATSATGLQAKVFELLDMGKSIDEVCAALSISKGAAELHYHIYRAKRIAT